MRPVIDNNDPRVRMQRTQSIDAEGGMGVGTKHETNDTGAAIAQRKMQVAVTSPEIRHSAGAGRPEEVNKDLLTTRRTNVLVRSGNENHRSMQDSNLPAANYFEARGLADEDTVSASKAGLVGGQVGMLAALGVGAYFLFRFIGQKG